MKIATAFSLAVNTQDAIAELVATLQQALPAAPQVLLLYFTEQHDVAQLLACVRRAFPASQIMGCSSCQGIMTEAGYHSAQGWALAAWALCDVFGAYGSAGVACSGQDGASNESMAIAAVDLAMARSRRPGELPALVWLHASPGIEESVIRGIQHRLGGSVPIVGGSAADNSAAGRWHLLTQDGALTSGVAVTLFYPNCQIACAFHSAYMPAERHGLVTKAQGRELLEIDGVAAADVYNEWTQGAIAHARDGESIMDQTTLFPLAREVGVLAGVPYYKLSHPESVTARRGLRLFTEIQEGEEVILMQGNEADLLSRAVRSSDLTPRDHRALTLSHAIGALNIFCAGCMLAIGPAMGLVVESLRDGLGGIPFIAPFTFGEQGRFTGGENAHGNLMISTVCFYQLRVQE